MVERRLGNSAACGGRLGGDRCWQHVLDMRLVFGYARLVRARALDRSNLRLALAHEHHRSDRLEHAVVVAAIASLANRDGDAMNLRVRWFSRTNCNDIRV